MKAGRGHKPAGKNRRARPKAAPLETGERLRRQESYYRSILEHSQDIIIMLDRQGRIMKHPYAVPMRMEILGYGPEENEGRNALELVHPDDLPHIRSILSSLLVNPGSVHRSEFRMRAKDGTYVSVDATALNLSHDPAVGGIVVHYSNISDRKAAEEALRRKDEELRQAQRLEAVGRLAGGVAHDFNNLFTVIRGYSRMLLKRFQPGAPGREELEEIDKATDKAAAMTRQLLAFSRGQMLRPKVLDLPAMLSDMEHMLRKLAGDQVKVVLRPESGLARVKADPGQVTQVVMNLAVNARDAMPRGGTMTVTTSAVRADKDFTLHHPEVQEGDYVEMRVADTGTGMDAETLSHAFEPFFTTKAPGRGTGLGLATVYGIVRQSGGYVWAESEPGRGTEFHVLLPRVENGTAEAAPVPEAGRGGAGETVLLAEDEDMVRGLVKALLSAAGYTVLEARNGMEALDIAERHGGKLDLLLTDVVMPSMTGFELAEKLALRRPDTHIVYMSGYADRAVVQDNAMKLGRGFLEKPFSDDELLARVREALDAR